MSYILIFTLLFSSFSNEAGQTALAHLKLPLGARADGMGEAYSAIAKDATAGWWNAAALPQLESTQFVFNHCSHFQGITLDYLGVATSFGGNGVGFGVMTFSSGELEYREKASQEPLGTFSVIAFHPILSYGRRIDPELSLGITVIGLYEKIYLDEATGIAFNGGILYRPEYLQGARFAAVFQNFGPKFGLREITYTLPFRAKAGFGYSVKAKEFELTAASDYVWPLHGKYKLNTGVELSYRSLVFLRTGYKFGYDIQQLSFGLGVNHKGLSVDYAYSPYRELGASHKVSLLITP